jgi:hypothetical protein
MISSGSKIGFSAFWYIDFMFLICVKSSCLRADNAFERLRQENSGTGECQMNASDGPELNALVAAVAQRLAGRVGANPAQPDLEQPLLWDPPEQLPDVLWPRRHLALAGLELTQSIQYNGAVGVSYGDDNSIPLVALKPLVVRAYPYVQPGIAAPDTLTGARVTGELVLSVGDRVVYRTGPTRVDGARLGARNELSRELWDTEFTAPVGGPGELAVRLVHVNSSLNFVVPAWYCRSGHFYLSVRLWRAGSGGALSAPQDHVTTGRYIDFMEVRPPRVAVVRVNWTDSSGNVTSPTDAIMLSTMRTAERMLPFPYFETTILGSPTNSSAAFAPAATGGACNTAWTALLADLAVTRIFTALFQLGDIVFAFVPSAAVPAAAGTYNTGCGRAEGVGAAFAGSDTRFAYDFIFAHRWDTSSPATTSPYPATRPATLVIQTMAEAKPRSAKSGSIRERRHRRFSVRRTHRTSCPTNRSSGSLPTLI